MSEIINVLLVIEARNLPKMDTLGKADPYGIKLFFFYSN